MTFCHDIVNMLDKAVVMRCHTPSALLDSESVSVCRVYFKSRSTRVGGVVFSVHLRTRNFTCCVPLQSTPVVKLLSVIHTVTVT